MMLTLRGGESKSGNVKDMSARQAADTPPVNGGEPENVHLIGLMDSPGIPANDNTTIDRKRVHSIVLVNIPFSEANVRQANDDQLGQ